MSLIDGLTQSVDTRRLAHTGCTELFVFGKHNGIALAMLHELVGEQQVVDQRSVDGFYRDGTQIVGRLDLEVALLHQGAVEHRAELTCGSEFLLLAQDDAVFLLTENTERRRLVGRRYNNLEENFVDFLGRSTVDNAVRNEHASECRYRIAGERILPRLGYRRPGSHTTGVVVLENGERRLGELADKRYGGVDVKKIVI